jgi:hypothetical protein
LNSLLFLSFLALFACSTTSKPEPQPDKSAEVFVEEKGEAPATEPAAASVDHPALEGCRAPDQDGCNPCCDASAEEGACHKREWAGGGVTHIDPWYNKVSRIEGGCPEGCSACASCSKRAEEQFRRLVARPDCDCSEDPGVDPCFRPGSCGCYCVRFKDLSSACPQLELPPLAAP